MWGQRFICVIRLSIGVINELCSPVFPPDEPCDDDPEDCNHNKERDQDDYEPYNSKEELDGELYRSDKSILDAHLLDDAQVLERQRIRQQPRRTVRRRRAAAHPAFEFLQLHTELAADRLKRHVVLRAGRMK